MTNSSESVAPPRLWSDFDGTAVELARWYQPRNWAKYPLLPIPGYADFLRGVKQEGVDISGIVTARPNNFQRRWATHRSIAKLGLDGFFHEYNTLLKGSHSAKAEILVQESERAPVGMIEDLPARLIPALLRTILLRESSTRHPLTLGIVDTGNNSSYLEGTVAVFDRSPEFEVTASDSFYTVEADNFELSLGILKPYSEESGREFALKLKDSV